MMFMFEESVFETEFNNSIGISLKELLEYYRTLCEQ